MESYIVRIYRYQPGTPRRLVGTLQSLDSSMTPLAFTGLEELWTALQQQLDNDASAPRVTEDQNESK